MSLLAAFLPILILLPTIIRASCYFPDGSLSPSDVPCDASISESFCCFSAQACLSNKLCYEGQDAGLDGQDGRKWESPPPVQEMGEGEEAMWVELLADGRS